MEEVQTTKIDKVLKKAIDRVFEVLVMTICKVTQAAHLHLVRVILLLSTQISHKIQVMKTASNLNAFQTVLLKLQVRALANLPKQTTLDICHDVYQ